MKHIRSTINLIAAFGICMIFNHCGRDEIEGIFYISDDARKYQIDTTITAFSLVDNFGMSEEFHLDESSFAPHHYFSEWGGKAWGEKYGVSYESAVNRFSFLFVLKANEESTEFEIEWNQKDRLIYDFRTKTVDSDIKAKVNFFDTLTVNGITYAHIIEVDYTDHISAIDYDTPVKTYISGNEGLIKFVRRDDIILERIE